ncbi:energy transducer TonB [Flavicella sediminum]|uniref:energy transducer TonB n=1 Tax=Flavicella sediminum TaxID=2585141 RepID=UPI00111D53DD|nr:energy transducer TonB [Flavicella sediminum]
MEVKKNPKSNLENYTKLFIQLGLVLALFCVYVGIEHKTYDRIVADLGVASLSVEDEEEMVITQRVEPVKPPPPPPPPAPEIIEVVEDEKEVEETVIETTETDEEEAVEVEEIVEAEEGEEVIEDVPFAIIEDIPVFPGCEKGTKDEKKACFMKEISKFINRKFNANLASDLGLSAGKKRIFVMFKIDKTGGITEIRARAPHPRLQKEAERVVKMLPKMIPGKQRGRPVAVRYSLPISFQVE